MTSSTCPAITVVPAGATIAAPPVHKLTLCTSAGMMRLPSPATVVGTIGALMQSEPMTTRPDCGASPQPGPLGF